ncbi:MAG: ribonuclease Y [Demequinaceae bacterium]|nr:ribonuclease Y [Demequinaceae bacterium]
MWTQSLIIVLLLAACLVALLLVQFARKEATAEREAAHRDSITLREEAKAVLANAKRREERLESREREVVADQRAAAEYSRSLEERANLLGKSEKKLAAEKDTHRKRIKDDLAAIVGLTPEDAREELVKKLTAEAEADTRTTVRRIERRALEEAESRVRQILVSAMQRHAGETTTQQTVTWISLPNEEMKGRIIGREGRNIRTFEALTGVNLILEEGTNAVMLSSFDLERREIAEATLAHLIQDGRIQPHRIEAAYKSALEAAPERNNAAAVDALTEAGVAGLHSDIVETLGRLRLRTSYGQNVLGHLVECAHIAAEIAREIGADVEVARRAAFLHDLGKAFSAEREGTHAAIGAEEIARCGESPAVVNAVAAHHDEVPQETLEAVIVQIADAVSASRPGARRDDYEGYVERLESLEARIREFEGVADVVVMSAGREIRVVVEPTTVGDEGIEDLAFSIAKEIGKDPAYPGEIKVTVIRELRAEAVAN